MTNDATKSCMSKRSIQIIRQTLDFNITQYEKFIRRVLDSALQLTFEKSLLPTEFWCSIKQEYLNYLKRLLNTLLFSPGTCLYRYIFFSYGTKTTYCNELNAEIDENLAGFCEIRHKEIFKNKKKINAILLTIFLSWKICYFPEKCHLC